MVKWKVVSIVLAVILALIVFVGLFDIWWNGGFNASSPREIATYTSPDGEYILVFEQVGSPWFFGPADVQLTLRDSQGGCLDTFCTDVWNDGASASAWNIRSIQWDEDTVTVILNRGEQRDQGYIFFFNRYGL